MDNLFPCLFEENSHQHFAKGICHGVGKTKCGRPYAILEFQDGNIVVRTLGEHYSIKLIREKT